MLKLILVIVGLTIIMCKPFLLFLGAAVGLAWLLFSRPNSFTAINSIFTSPAKSKDRTSNLSRQKDFMTYEERQDKEMSSIKFKEGFKDDPRWQAKARSVGVHVKKAQEIEEAKLRELGQSIKNMG